MSEPLIIDGKTVAASVHAKSIEQIAEIKEKYGTVPGLAVILVGENPASQVYVGTKVKKCAELGIYSEKIVLPENTTQEELLAVIDRLNKDPKIHGILVQSPPPKQINEEEVVLAIDPAKDVDCFHPFNAGKLFLGDTTGFMPCTPYGVMKLLEYYNIEIAGKNAVVVGRSNIVGRPMSQMLLTADATVTVCHSRTKNLAEITKTADILICAAGKAGLIKKDMVKEGAVVIDVGMNRDENGKLCGDVDFAGVSEVASFITPVPGGVGPMTICSLMVNAYELSQM